MFVFGKIGFAANDAATSLKMVEKGLLREDLAVAVLINFPFQIIGGWLVGTWSRGEYPLRPWLYTFWPRIGFAFTAMLIVYWFPTPPVSPGFFFFLVVHTVLTSFTSCVQNELTKQQLNFATEPSSSLAALLSLHEYRTPSLAAHT
jgi:hypothetical protein